MPEVRADGLQIDAGLEAQHCISVPQRMKMYVRQAGALCELLGSTLATQETPIALRPTSDFGAMWSLIPGTRRTSRVEPGLGSWRRSGKGQQRARDRAAPASSRSDIHAGLSCRNEAAEIPGEREVMLRGEVPRQRHCGLIDGEELNTK
jgi:hypothetical protein